MIPLLTSERLRYRLVEAADLPWLFELHSDPEVMKFIRAPDRERGQTESWLNSVLKYQAEQPGLGIFVVARENDEVIGWGVLLHMERKLERDVEVGYRLFKRSWGQGYATEIAHRLIEYGFKDLKLPRIVGVTNPDHRVSQHVLEKVGLSEAGFTDYVGARVKVQAILAEEFRLRSG